MTEESSIPVSKTEKSNTSEPFFSDKDESDLPVSSEKEKADLLRDQFYGNRFIFCVLINNIV